MHLVTFKSTILIKLLILKMQKIIFKNIPLKEQLVL